MDLIDRYEEAADAFTDRLDAVGDDQWANPTPCTDWVVRQLVDHVITIQRQIPEGLGLSVDDGADAREKWNSVRAAAVEALRQPGVLDRTMPGRGGGDSRRDGAAPAVVGSHTPWVGSCPCHRRRRTNRRRDVRDRVGVPRAER
jgi:uncharacterized protein (TIGR03083 family)